jgi:hypothetical protein
MAQDIALHLNISCVPNFNSFCSSPGVLKMTSRPVVSIIGPKGKASDKTHPLPNVFRSPIRPDIVQYGTSPMGLCFVCD